MIDISQTALDEMCDNFEVMKFKAGPWWPTMEEINTKIKPRIKEYLKFVIWITETAEEPKTEEEKKAKSSLLKLIYENLRVVNSPT